MDGLDTIDLLQLTSRIVAAYVSHNRVGTADLPDLIARVHEALGKIDASVQPARDAAEQKPAVAVKNSIKSDHIVCLEDGKKLKMLKRYLMTNYKMTPDEYRAKWRLPVDYPMVAPDYADRRRALAKVIGLGRKREPEAPPPAPTPAAKPGRGRRKAAAELEPPARKPRRGRRAAKA